MKNNATLYLTEPIRIAGEGRDELRCFVEGFDDHGVRIETDQVVAGQTVRRSLFIPHDAPYMEYWKRMHG